MAGITAKRHPKVDEKLLSNVVRKLIATEQKLENIHETVGNYLFETIFNSDLKQAVQFAYNPYYRELKTRARANQLGSLSAAWLKKVVHVDTMTRVLRDMDLSKDYDALNFSQKSRFVGVSFSRASFVAATAQTTIEQDWNATTLSMYLRKHSLKTNQSKMTAALAKRTLTTLLRAAEKANSIRRASKAPYRKMLRFLDEDEFEGHDKMVKAYAKEWSMYMRDHEAERKMRRKKRK